MGPALSPDPLEALTRSDGHTVHRSIHLTRRCDSQRRRFLSSRALGAARESGLLH